MRPPTRKSTAPMCEPSSAPSRLRAMRRKSDGFIAPLFIARTPVPQVGKLCQSRTGRLKLGFKLLVEPAREGRKLLVAAKEGAHHLAAWLRSALLEHRFAVARAGFAAEQVGGIELAEEIERD